MNKVSHYLLGEAIKSSATSFEEIALPWVTCSKGCVARILAIARKEKSKKTLCCQT